MEESIRQALLTAQKVPPSELTPDDWLTVINRLLDQIESLAKHMRFPISAADHIRKLEREHPGTKFFVRVRVFSKPDNTRLRLALLGGFKYSSWDHVELAFGEDGDLRVIHVRWTDVEIGGDRVPSEPVYQSGILTGDELFALLAASPKDANGVNALGLSAIRALTKLTKDNAVLKAKHAQSFVDAVEKVARVTANLAR